MNYTASKLLEIALAEVGYYEKKSLSMLDDKTANAGSGNYTKYARDLYDAGYYNGSKQGVSWCSVFVDWCHYMASEKQKSLAQKISCQSGIYGASCTYSMGYYRSAGRFFTQKPQIGDQIYFGSGKTAEHTGIVCRVDADRVYTVEGNTSAQSGIVSNGGGVFCKSYPLNHSKILGYGRPYYDEEQPAEEETPEGFTDAAKYMDTAKIGVYKVKECSGLNLRTGAGTEYESLALLPGGTPVVCMGYYTGDWLRVETADSRVGFCHSDYLIRSETK